MALTDFVKKKKQAVADYFKPTENVRVRDFVREVPGAVGQLFEGTKNVVTKAPKILGEGAAYALDKNVRDQYQAGNTDILPTVTNTSPKSLLADTARMGLEIAPVGKIKPLAQFALSSRLPARMAAGGVAGYGYDVATNLSKEKPVERKDFAPGMSTVAGTLLGGMSRPTAEIAKEGVEQVKRGVEKTRNTASQLPNAARNSINNRLRGPVRVDSIPSHWQKSDQVRRFNPRTRRVSGNQSQVRGYGDVMDTGFQEYGQKVQKRVPEQRIERFRTPTLSQLGREVRDALPRPGMSIQAVDDPLISEARKYKSAEEFVKAQGTQVYRGGLPFDKKLFNSGKLRGLSVAPDRETAEWFARPSTPANEYQGGIILKGEKGIIEELVIDKNAKILQSNKSPKELQNILNKEDSHLGKEEIAKWAEQHGYDAVDFGGGDFELRILNPEKIKTKSQLTDLWKKANEGKTLSDLGKEVIDSLPRPGMSIQAVGGGKPTKYKTATANGIIDVDGSPVKIIDGIETFLHKDNNGNWAVSEVTTGRSLNENGGFPTQKHAIEDAKNAIEYHGKDAFLEKIEKYKINQKTTPVKKYSPESVKVGIENAKAKAGNIPSMTADEAKNTGYGAMYNASENKPAFDSLFSRFIADKDIAKTAGYQKGSQIEIPKGEEWNIVKAIEGTGKTTATDALGKIQSEFDDAFKSAKEFGIDINYLKGYIQHVWEQSPAEVQRVFQTMGQRFSGSKRRLVPTYEEGISLGLTPKYNNPRQILAHYIQKLEETKANINFLKGLKENGLIVDASVASKTPGLVPINAPGMAKSRSRIDGETAIVGNYFADPEIAQTINQAFGGVPQGTLGKALDKSAGASSRFQDLTLSGGIPKTPLNAFTLAQMTKEVLAGRLQSPLGSFFRSMSGEATENFYQKNIDTIQKMQSRNIPISTTLDIDSLGETGFFQKAFTGTKPGTWEKVKSVWQKSMNEPTFKRFMGQLQVNLFNDIEKKALSSGKTAEEAVDIASGAVKNFYGLTKTDAAAKRDPMLSDLASTALFAPRYREAMINFWVNNLKALGHPLKLENRTNMAFNVGALALFAGYDYLNQQLNGNHLWENPKGKEDKLLIPGEETTVGLPYLSSIATIPRAIYREGKMLTEGDISGAAKDAFQTFSSSMVKPAADVLANSDYFGNEIYDKNDVPSEKIKSAGKYLLKQYTGHPYVKTGIDAIGGDKSTGQLISQATEMPLRFYKTESIKNAPFWEEYENQKKRKEIMSDMKYGRISQEAGSRQLDRLGNGEVEKGKMITTKNGSIAFKTSKGIQFADTEEEAKLEIAKDEFRQTGKNQGEYEGMIFRKSKDGDVTATPKVDWEISLNYQKRQLAKKSKDIDAYFKAAEEEYKALQYKYQNGDLDEVEKMELESKAQTLRDEYTKYKSYKGFTKPKTGSTKKQKTIANPKESVSFILNDMKSRLKPLRAFSSRRTNLASVRRPSITRKKLRAYA